MHNTRIAIAVLALLCLFLVAGVAQANGPAITWWVFSGGGAPASAAGAITLKGSLGQMAAGRSASGDYVLNAGYWLERRAMDYIYYFPIMAKKAVLPP